MHKVQALSTKKEYLIFLFSIKPLKTLRIVHVVTDTSIFILFYQSIISTVSVSIYPSEYLYLSIYLSV